MIHPREIEILNILAGGEKPMMSADIVDAGNRLSQSTVQAVLRKLLKEGFVEVEGITHSGNVLARTYRITDAAREAVLDQYIQDYQNISNIVMKDEVIGALK